MVEAAVLFYSGLTWIVPYPAMLVVVIALPFPAITGWPKGVLALIAAGFAALFIMPGSVLVLLGSCGSVMASHCSNQEFLSGVAAYAVASALNVFAAVLIARSPGKEV